MKRLELLFIFFLIALTIKTAKTQNYHCTNLSLELGDFTNWEGYIYNYPARIKPTPPPNWIQVTIPNGRRLVVVPNDRSILPPRFKYYARLGESNPLNEGWQQKLRYTMTIDSASALLVVKFSFSLFWKNKQPAYQQPQFSFTLF